MQWLLGQIHATINHLYWPFSFSFPFLTSFSLSHQAGMQARNAYDFVNNQPPPPPSFLRLMYANTFFESNISKIYIERDRERAKGFERLQKASRCAYDVIPTHTFAKKKEEKNIQNQHEMPQDHSFHLLSGLRFYFLSPNRGNGLTFFFTLFTLCAFVPPPHSCSPIFVI